MTFNNGIVQNFVPRGGDSGENFVPTPGEFDENFVPTPGEFDENFVPTPGDFKSARGGPGGQELNDPLCYGLIDFTILMLC